MIIKFLEWFKENQTEITWWVIGWLSFAVLDSLLKGEYAFALFDAFLIGFNYYMWKNAQ